jgi:hypothetical protein
MGKHFGCGGGGATARFRDNSHRIKEAKNWKKVSVYEEFAQCCGSATQPLEDHRLVSPLQVKKIFTASLVLEFFHPPLSNPEKYWKCLCLTINTSHTHQAHLHSCPSLSTIHSMAIRPLLALLDTVLTIRET